MNRFDAARELTAAARLVCSGSAPMRRRAATAEDLVKALVAEYAGEQWNPGFVSHRQYRQFVRNMKVTGKWDGRQSYEVSTHWDDDESGDGRGSMKFTVTIEELG